MRVKYERERDGEEERDERMGRKWAMAELITLGRNGQMGPLTEGKVSQRSKWKCNRQDRFSSAGFPH